MGRDDKPGALELAEQAFQSTRPVWGATTEAPEEYRDIIISIHAPRMGRDGVRAACAAPRVISIHAPRMGRDNRMH